LAAALAAKVRGIQPEGPYHLAGYCFEGVVAIEVARLLANAGHQVAFLGLMECAPFALPHRRAPWKDSATPSPSPLRTHQGPRPPLGGPPADPPGRTSDDEPGALAALPGRASPNRVPVASVAPPAGERAGLSHALGRGPVSVHSLVPPVMVPRPRRCVFRRR